MRDDGGPAFPIQASDADGSYLPHPGMSLRDHFAGQALTGLVARVHVSPEASAEIAYELADAMLKARELNAPD